MKIAVIGLGAIGSQVLWQLSRQPGLELHGFDTHYPGHSTAGAGGDSRLFWNLELQEPAYAPLILRAAELWEELEREAGMPLRDRTGVLVFGSQGAQQLEQAIASTRDTGTPIELLGNDELAQRFPQFDFDERTIGVWDIDGAVIRPELTVCSAAGLAAANGAAIHEFTRVKGVEIVSGGGVRVETDRSEMFDRVVVACGGWTPKLLPYLNTEVVVRRLTSAWYHADEARYLTHLPPFMQTAPGYCYGIPDPAQRSVKLGLGFNDHLVTNDPDQVPRSLSDASLDEQIRKFDWVRQRLLPGLNRRPYRLDTYVESYTRAMLEYLRFHPETNDLLVLTGFSGHGFRVAPAIGEVGAELVLRERSTIDVSFLRQAEPAFEILDPEEGTTSHNPVMSSAER